MTNNEKVKLVGDLLERAGVSLKNYNGECGILYTRLCIHAGSVVGDLFEEIAPDENWNKQLFSLTGEHMILTDEGWEPGAAKESYLEEDPEWQPLDEVNAPVSENRYALSATMSDEQSAADEIVKLRISVAEYVKLTNENQRLQSRVAELEVQLKTCGEILEADRTKVADGVAAIQKEIDSRSWLRNSRGLYAFDDAEYQKEFGWAIDAIQKATEPLIEIGRDFRNCPSNHIEVIRSRIDLHKRVDYLEKAAAYYKAAICQQFTREMPPFVPKVITIPQDAHGDFPFHQVCAPAGQYAAFSGGYGAVSITATNGDKLGLRPHEFEVVEWQENADAKAVQSGD